MKTLWEKALDYLYRDLKRTRIALGNAERKSGVSQTELDDLNGKIDLIEWLIALVLKEDATEPPEVKWMKVAVEYILQLESDRFDVLDDISMAYNDSMTYFLESDGRVHNRYSGKRMSFDEAVGEFVLQVAKDREKRMEGVE